ncbi:MAG: phage head closure protein [Hyphomicrobiales bacterium]|nr:phage head closure protein [Hyphomicrobiales bacterium]
MSLRIDTAGLRSRVTLQTPVDTADDSGALVRAWTPVADVWAKIEPQRGDETFVAGEQESVLVHRVTVRWRPDLASPMRFVLGSRALYVRAAFDPDGRKKFLVCRCDEYAA